MRLTPAALLVLLLGCAAPTEYGFPAQTGNDAALEKFVDQLEPGYYEFDRRGNPVRILDQSSGQPITACPDWQVEYHIYARRPDVLGCKNKPEPAPGSSAPQTCSDFVLLLPGNEFRCVKSCEEHGLVGIQRPNANYRECAP